MAYRKSWGLNQLLDDRFVINSGSADDTDCVWFPKVNGQGHRGDKRSRLLIYCTCFDTKMT